MRLSELTGYKNRLDYKNLTANPSVARFVNIAKKEGWTLLGSGGNGAALQHPGKNYVYKIFSSRSEADGFHAYINWVLKHPNNQFVPKIGRPTKIANTSHDQSITIRGKLITIGRPKQRDLYFIRMELLDPAKGENDPRFEKYIDPDFDRTKTDQFSRDHDGDPTLFDHAKVSLWFNNKDYKEIWTYADDQWDGGIGNFMFRGDQLVIIDPMA